MTRCLVVLISFLLPAILVGQQALDENKRLAYGNPFNAGNENFINAMNALEENEQVSLLLYPGWRSLEIFGADEEYLVFDSANYHIQADKILFVHKGNMYELYPEMIDSATIGESSFISTIFEKDKQSLERGYFEVLVQGEYRLYRRYVLEQQVSNDSPLGLPATKEVKFVRSADLFYMGGGARRPTALPRKKGDFIKIFRTDRDEMIDYAKSNRLSIRKSEDVSALFNYYNSLQNEG